jgi:hypothetical protein
MKRERERKELWHQLDNESDRAHTAFRTFMLLPPAERSVVGAWRLWTENPEAARPSPFFEGWAREYAWSDRARARDHHIELIRERGMEKAIEEEAKFQARQVEQLRFRYQEMLSVFYERAMSCLEESEGWQTLRPMDVINIVRLHGEAMDRLGEPEAQAPEADWEETDEDDEVGRRIVEEVDAEAEERRAEEDDPEPEEGLPEEDEAEEA